MKRSEVSSPGLFFMGNAREIAAMLRGEPGRILTFVGYSAAEYQDPAAMLRQAGEVLGGCDRHDTLVNIGATEPGIGVVYALAKSMGFRTLGVVSALARSQNARLSPHVDDVYFVEDSSWGGLVAGTTELSPTSRIIVGVSHRLVGIGGGEVAGAELLAARQAGKPVMFIPADMNHRIARERAHGLELPEPEDFRGAAHAAWIRENAGSEAFRP